MFTIDNNNYDVGVIKITRKASHKVDNIGTTMDLKKHYDIRGTYYDYEIELATSHMNINDYDNLYEDLTAPSGIHLVRVPYGQTTMEFEARVSVANDSLIKSYNNFKKWGNLKITCEALTPQREEE